MVRLSGARVLVEYINTIAKRQETFVDIGSFFHPEACVPSARCPFGPSKVDQGELARFYFGVAVRVQVVVVVCDHEDGVGAGGCLVCHRRLLGPIGIPFGKELEYLILVTNLEDREALDQDAIARILSELEAGLLWHD